ncbi:hypothetical protein Q2941_15460 [Bradyrhizobium sp. UFLA05-153]
MGAGLTSYSDWIPVEFTDIDATNAQDWRRYFVPDSISNILAEHVWQHMTAEQGLAAARVVHEYLRNGGCFRVAVPDRNHPSPDYYDDSKPDPRYPRPQGFLRQRLNGRTSHIGRLLRCDTDRVVGGSFNEVPWDDERGHIKRSAHNSPRNTNGKLTYTSLIVDAIK